MNAGPDSLENLRQKRNEVDKLLERREAECRDLRQQRNALECAIAVLANGGITPQHPTR